MSIDLRSDTVTKPTEPMRRAMATADVGDDVYVEDPTALRLQERAAEILGKQAALFVPTGSMANQIALLAHCRPGDEVIVGHGAHTNVFESGAGGAFAGVQFVTVGTGGLFEAEEMEAVIRPRSVSTPVARSRLVEVENTHNLSGGRVFPQGNVVEIAERAHARGLSVHVDGARIWNAAVATGISPATLCAPADTVSACFSKGLGAPVGSVIAGTADLIAEARRFRRMLGGGMRQVGILCAAALYALDHHMDRLVDDHDHARALAEGIAGTTGFVCDPARVETNIVNFAVSTMEATKFSMNAAEHGVLVNPIGPRSLRAVTHLDVTRTDIERAIAAFRRASG